MATEVEPVDPSKTTSDIAGPMADEATVSMEMMEAKCLWNGQEFNNGDQVSSEGKSYTCSFGRWVEDED